MRQTLTACCAAALLIFCWLLANTMHRAVSFVWLAYLWRPTPSLWDFIHSQEEDEAGGVWHVGPNVHSELSCYIDTHYPRYTSLLDASSNLGYMLKRLQRTHPNASHFGTDISPRMVAATMRRCPSCVAQQFDLHRLLFDGHFEPGEAGVPPVAELVLVSDVLYFLSWAGWPPALLQRHSGLRVPVAWLRASQKRFFARLRRMASVEVIFSSHQFNSVVIDAFAANGITRRHGVFSAAGTAARDHHEHANSPRRLWWLRRTSEQRVVAERFWACVNDKTRPGGPRLTGKLSHRQGQQSKPRPPAPQNNSRRLRHRVASIEVPLLQKRSISMLR